MLLSGFFGITPEKTKLSGHGSLGALSRAAAMISTAHALSGTENASFVFILDGGMVHVAFFPRSNSRHCAPSVSLVRVAPKIKNSSAKAAMLSDARRRCTKPGVSA
jgi:hypothetical protein